MRQWNWEKENKTANSMWYTNENRQWEANLELCDLPEKEKTMNIIKI